jgi:hypothetical protein
LSNFVLKVSVTTGIIFWVGFSCFSPYVSHL